MDPHLACQNINLWGNGLADSSGSYTIDGWPPSGSQEQDYASTWSYTGGTQVIDVIDVNKLISTAIANGDAPQNSQGFHFKLQFSADPQKHKTFWVDCQAPTVTTTAASATAGQAIHDVANLSGGASPTGTIVWNVYRSSDTTCSSSLGTVQDTVNGDGTYTSPDFMPPSVGGYQWVATYSGDSQNISASTPCNDPSEESIVTKADPSIVTAASSTTIGGPVHDQAVLSGGDAPTGSITWSVYVAGTNCATPLFTTAAVSVNGDTTYSSPSYTPSAAGTYEWVATYSGDANNNPLTSSCSDPAEQSVVSPASPSLSTMASGPVMMGQPISDTAVLSGGVAPTGSITWTVYAVGTNCATALFTSSAVPVNGDGSYSSPSYTPSAAGTYQWVAAYSGDTNNSAFTSPCNVTSEQSVVDSPPPTPPTPPTPPSPGISVIKLQRDGSSGPFTTHTITAKVGDTIEYEIRSTDTGNTTLALSLNDPLCNAGTTHGPFEVSGTLVGNVLSPGGVAQYTCSHVLSASDASPFTNTATITGQPPSGPPVDGTASVTADKQAVSPVRVLRCAHGKVKKHKKVHGKTVTVCVKRVAAAVVHRRIPTPRFTG